MFIFLVMIKCSFINYVFLYSLSSFYIIEWKKLIGCDFFLVIGEGEKGWVGIEPQLFQRIIPAHTTCVTKERYWMRLNQLIHGPNNWIWTCHYGPVFVAMGKSFYSVWDYWAITFWVCLVPKIWFFLAILFCFLLSTIHEHKMCRNIANPTFCYGVLFFWINKYWYN